MKRVPIFSLVLTILIATRPGMPEAPGGKLKHFTVREVVRGLENREEGILIRPLALTFDAENLYVADAEDCAVKVFSKKGRFERSIGRKGQGPGEFSFPSGVSISDGQIIVSDKFNFRIQILDVQGTSLGGFKVPFAPDRVFALGEGVILVTRNPSGRGRNDRLLQAFDRAGRRLWEAFESFLSGDPVYDSFQNMIQVSPGEGGDFFVLPKCRERSVFRFERQGRCLERIPLDEGYEVRRLSLPFKKGSKNILGVCWAWAFAGERFYVLAPDDIGGMDLGPGTEVFVFDRRGRLEGMIPLPVPAIQMAVDGERLYMIDEDRELRIFRIVG